MKELLCTFGTLYALLHRQPQLKNGHPLNQKNYSRVRAAASFSIDARVSHVLLAASRVPL